MEIVEARSEDRVLLWNINQKYLYEMTNYYDVEMDQSGILHYGFFDDYFTDPKRRAFLLYDCEKLVGFAMVHPYSNTGGSADHVMAEFTIFPAYRRRQLATCAAALFFERFKGRWEVKYNENNTAAKRFWTKVTSGFSPTAKRLNDLETMLSFKTG